MPAFFNLSFDTKSYLVDVIGMGATVNSFCLVYTVCLYIDMQVMAAIA